MDSEELIEKLVSSLKNYDVDTCLELSKTAVESGVEPVKAIDRLTEAIREIGEAFNREELWLPELMMASDVMKNVMPIFEEELLKKGQTRKVSGTLVIGTVLGDVHDIGKSMVATMFIAAGYQVYDIGIDVPAEKFIEAVKKYKPDILGMSALLTMTALQMGAVIATLKTEGLRDKVKVLVGGGALTPDLAQTLGADGYSANAAEAVAAGDNLLGTRKET